jgi:hypothetical protein
MELQTTASLQITSERIEFMDYLKQLMNKKQMDDFHKEFENYNERENQKYKNLKTTNENELPNQSRFVEMDTTSMLSVPLNLDSKDSENEPKIKEV